MLTAPARTLVTDFESALPLLMSIEKPSHEPPLTRAARAPPSLPVRLLLVLALAHFSMLASLGGLHRED
jgi:hypothetical protein